MSTHGLGMGCSTIFAKENLRIRNCYIRVTLRGGPFYLETKIKCHF